MKNLLGIALLVLCTIVLGACSSLPPAPAGDTTDYGSSTPR